MAADDPGPLGNPTPPPLSQVARTGAPSSSSSSPSSLANTTTAPFPAASIPYYASSPTTSSAMADIPSSEDDAIYTQFQLQLHLQEAQLEDERRQLEYSLAQHSQQQPQQQHFLPWSSPGESPLVSAITLINDLSSMASSQGAIYNQVQQPELSPSPLHDSSSLLHMPSLVAQNEALAPIIAARPASSAFMPTIHDGNNNDSLLAVASEQIFHTHDNPNLNTRCNITLGGAGGQGLDGTSGCDEEEDDDYLPPSELKYILYDDHVSPITIQEALVILNDHLHDPRMLDQSVAIDRDAQEQIRNDGGGLWDPAVDVEEESDLSYLDRLGLEQDDDDNDEEAGGQDKEDDELAAIFETNRRLPSPTSAQRGYPFPSMSGGSSGDQRLLTCGFKSYADTRSATTGDSTLSQQNLLQPQRRTRKEPDISLNLAGQSLVPDHIHDLYFSRHYSRLVHLNLWDTNLGTWGAQAVGGLLADRTCQIQYLNLGRNRLGFEGMLQLSGMYKNYSLVELDLSDNQLGPKAVHCLQQILVRLKNHEAGNVRRLNLSNNEINDVGCISIAKILVGTPIQHLDLSFNQISDWGASTILRSFSEARTELTLEGLLLEANPLTFAGGVDMCKMLTLPQSRVCHLDLRGAKVTDVGVPYLAEALKLHDCILRTLNLYDCQLTDTGILKLAVKLCVNNSLRVLGLGANCIGDMGIAALSQGLCLNNKLEELDISENEAPLSRAGAEALLATMRGNCTLLSLMIDSGDPHHHGHHHQHTLPRPAGMFDVFLEDDPEGGDDEQSIGTGGSSANNTATLGLTSSTTVATAATAAGDSGQAATTTTAEDEQALAQERRRLELALKTLKSYVRLNHKRTMRLRSQCFEMLVNARILIFGRDGNPDTVESLQQPLLTTTRTEEVVRVYHDTKGHQGGTHKLMSIIPSNTGLPTPPLSISSGGIGGGSTMVVDRTQSSYVGSAPVLPVTPDDGMFPSKVATTTRPSLSQLPWEIKETILLCLDEDRVLTRQQFHAILKHASTRWETVRQPWERWGDVREAILEQTGCYYYTSS